jgi:hypothetical protein
MGGETREKARRTFEPKDATVKDAAAASFPKKLV